MPMIRNMSSCAVVAFVGLGLVAARPAAAETEPRVRFEQRETCVVGEACAATVQVTVGGGFHINEEFPSSRFKGSAHSGVSWLGRDSAKPNEFSQRTGDVTLDDKHTISFRVRFRVSDKDAVVAGNVRFVYCDESGDQCFPADIAVSLRPKLR